jgi:TRAP-type C4-dicarboxylate transport system permease large subunit
MILRRDTIIPCILGIFIIGLLAKKNIVGATKGVFDSFIVAGGELLEIIIVISCIVAMSKLLEEIGANSLMVKPFAKFIKTPDIAFWFIGIVMLIVSWFFWPSPATALVGAVLLPVALKVGLPAIGVAMAINLFGHGLALSTDYVIQGAPTITSSAAGVPVEAVMAKGTPLFFTMGIVTIITAYIMLKRDMKKGDIKERQIFYNDHDNNQNEMSKTARIAAIIVPVGFILDIIAMFIFQLRGGDATALIGGTAVILTIIISIFEYRKYALDKITQFIKEGFMFGMEIFWSDNSYSGILLPRRDFTY